MRLWARINKITVVRVFIYHMWRPLVNFVLSNLEALAYLGKRSSARSELKDIRDRLTIPTDLAFWYQNRNFEWRPDPWKGRIDYVSKPWVSVVRNKGDCDDMAEIARWVLHDKFDEFHLAHTYGSEGGHVVCVLREEEQWYLVSNTQVRKFPDPVSAVKSFYGDDTQFMYIRGIGCFWPGE